MYQVQARMRDEIGAEWEPVSLIGVFPGKPSRYHYDSPSEAEAALRKYRREESPSRGLMLDDVCDVRIVKVVEL